MAICFLGARKDEKHRDRGEKVVELLVPDR